MGILETSVYLSKRFLRTDVVVSDDVNLQSKYMLWFGMVGTVGNSCGVKRGVPRLVSSPAKHTQSNHRTILNASDPRITALLPGPNTAARYSFNLRHSRRKL